MTSKERAQLKSQAMKLDSIFQIGKASLTPSFTDAIRDALESRELIKITVLKNCGDDPGELAKIIAERTGSQVVQVIGKKIVLYKFNPDKEKKRKKKPGNTRREQPEKGKERLNKKREDRSKKGQQIDKNRNFGRHL